jgi:hypothetical protein
MGTEDGPRGGIFADRGAATCEADTSTGLKTGHYIGVVEFEVEGFVGRRDMANVLIHKARELRPQTRAAVEAELGRALKDDEEVSIMAFSTHEAPTGEARLRAGQKLESYFKRIDKQTANATDEDAEAALQEALKKARPGYREEE